MNCSIALGLPVEPQEIKKALFSIGSFKAFGFDGFPTILCQKHWDICGKDVINMVTSSFA